MSRSDATWVYLSLMEKYRTLKHLNATSQDEDVVADAANDLMSLAATLESVGQQFNTQFGEDVFKISDRPIS